MGFQPVPATDPLHGLQSHATGSIGRSGLATSSKGIIEVFARAANVRNRRFFGNCRGTAVPYHQFNHLN